MSFFLSQGDVSTLAAANCAKDELICLQLETLTG